MKKLIPSIRIINSHSNIINNRHTKAKKLIKFKHYNK